MAFSGITNGTEIWPQRVCESITTLVPKPSTGTLQPFFQGHDQVISTVLSQVNKLYISRPTFTQIHRYPTLAFFIAHESWGSRW
jgi:hypothetical protein